MTTIYTTKQELIEHEIIPALGDYGDDYDLEGIWNTLVERGLIDYDEAPGHIQDAGFFMVSSEDGTPGFWDAVEANEISAARG